MKRRLIAGAGAVLLNLEDGGAPGPPHLEVGSSSAMFLWSHWLDTSASASFASSSIVFEVEGVSELDHHMRVVVERDVGDEVRHGVALLARVDVRAPS